LFSEGKYYVAPRYQSNKAGKAILATIHRTFVFLHRWIGLTMVVFLVLVGLTGSILAFRTKIDRWINPQLYVELKLGVPPLDPATLAERAEAQFPHMFVGFFAVESEQVKIHCRPRTNPATGKPFELDFEHLFLDPYTGKVLGHRRSADLSEGRINIMPFIYNLHTSMAMGSTGERILGIVALIWTIDSFVGFYLTLPQGQGGFWKRWKHAWWVKWRSTPFRINFDLHRAGGLWFWLFVFVFAWSSVMLAHNPVYERVTGALFDYEGSDSFMSFVLPQPKDNPKLNWHEAQAAGERLMAEQAAKHGFTITRPFGMGYIPEFGVYTYDVRTSADIRGHGWDTGVWVDGDTGQLRKVFLPYGQHSGNTISTVLWGLHYGDIRDILAYRLLVFILGFVIVMLSVTGVYIWWKKRKARVLAASRVRP
jgi:uncharacterized iron-regulated membrane protein